MRKLFVLTCMALVAANVFPGSVAHATFVPYFQMPDPCDERWSPDTRPGHDPSYWAADLDWVDGYNLGKPAIASARGKVSLVADLGNESYGKYVIVDDGEGWSTLYAHLQTVSVALNSPIRRGTRIGTVGESGDVTGPHLHFEERLNGVDQPISFEGASITYNTTYTSKNCKMWNAAGHEAHGKTDFDGNGKSDAIRTSSSGWYVDYDSDGTNWINVSPSGYRLQDLAFGDFDGDNKTDALRTTGSSWLVMPGSSFPNGNSWSTQATSPYKLGELAFGDFDHNGITDAFRATGDNNLSSDGWYVDLNSNGSWNKVSPSHYEIKDLAFADFDGNGWTDAFLATGSQWKIDYNTNGSWNVVSGTNFPYKLPELGFADFDGDGKTDVIRPTGSSWQVTYASTFPNAVEQTRSGSNQPLRDLVFGDFDSNSQTDTLRGTESGWLVDYDSNGIDWIPVGTSGYGLGDLAFGSDA